MKGDFLPQYAAHAVIDLEDLAKKSRGAPGTGRYSDALLGAAALIRAGVHVVLPPNGEIYRDNRAGGDMPTSDEAESFGGLPAPVTVLEYPWTHPLMPGENPQARAPRRITVVVDGKQLRDEGVVAPDETFTATMFSVFFHETAQTWALMDLAMYIAQPLELVPRPEGRLQWGIKAGFMELISGRMISANDFARLSRPFAEFKPDLGAVIQCCHALRAGATLSERSEPSGARRRKFEKRGAGGFVYHVLTLPQHVSGRPGVPTGTHASPRFHIRRHHIRKLPSGALTFVRQCFVGSRQVGEVDKHYRVQPADIGAALSKIKGVDERKDG